MASYAMELLQYLQNSEYELLLYMDAQQVIVGDLPDPPDCFTEGAGNIDFGVYLYWITNSSSFSNYSNLSTPYDIFYDALEADLLINWETMPSSILNQNGNNYNYLVNNQLNYVDGSILSVSEYAVYDPYWLYCLFNFYETKKLYGLAPFSSSPNTTNASITSGTQIAIGLISDWGSGEQNAQANINALAATSVDYLIHLGDIYYSATDNSGDYYDNYYNSSTETDDGEVNENFLANWPGSLSGKSFTLNGNHEMYSGAFGYFNIALANQIFSQQNQCSYGLIQIADWSIIYLDSSYFSDNSELYMYGTLGGKNGAQYKWLKSLQYNNQNLNCQKVIILTHHNAFDPTCSSIPESEYYQPFWDEISGALGGDPCQSWTFKLI